MPKSFIHPSGFEGWGNDICFAFGLAFVGGFDLFNTSIQISPDKFAPEKLCACSPGWTLGLQKETFYSWRWAPAGLGHVASLLLQHEMVRTGSGALCKKCDRDYFKEGLSSKQCEPCPPGSTAPVGSTSVDDCKCKAGSLYKLNGTSTLSST